MLPYKAPRSSQKSQGAWCESSRGRRPLRLRRWPPGEAPAPLASVDSSSRLSHQVCVSVSVSVSVSGSGSGSVSVCVCVCVCVCCFFSVSRCSGGALGGPRPSRSKTKACKALIDGDRDWEGERARDHTTERDRERERKKESGERESARDSRAGLEGRTRCRGCSLRMREGGERGGGWWL